MAARSTSCKEIFSWGIMPGSGCWVVKG
jgi:hypothetical protein